MLIHFSTETVPGPGYRIRLQAVLADTETVEIMEHRYLMSERQRCDVGLVAAPEDYVHRLAGEAPPQRTPGSIITALKELLTKSGPLSRNIYLT